MILEYQQLIKDLRQLLQEYDPSTILLTPHTFSVKTRAAESHPAKPEFQKTVAPLAIPTPKKEPIISSLPSQPHSAPSVQRLIPSPVLEVQKMKALMHKAAPYIKIVEQIPEDSRAKKIASAWKEKQQDTEIAILSFGETENEQLFLYNLAKAINTSIRPARVLDGRRLEKEKKWTELIEQKSLRYLFAPPVIASWPGLMEYYKESLITKEIFLGSKPLFLLEPLAVYLDNTPLKRVLWQRICSLQ